MSAHVHIEKATLREVLAAMLGECRRADLVGLHPCGPITISEHHHPTGCYAGLITWEAAIIFGK